MGPSVDAPLFSKANTPLLGPKSSFAKLTQSATRIGPRTGNATADRSDRNMCARQLLNASGVYT